MALADISFVCPHCEGPLIAEVAHAGLRTDCPHCCKALEVPQGKEINKNQFQEPSGLRRVFQQVRDRERENLRRELRDAKARNAELQIELEGFHAAPAERGADTAAECERLREQLEAANQKLTQASDDLAASREQHGVTLNALRAEREQSRVDAESFRAEIQTAEAAAEPLRQLVHVLEAKLEIEHAKVFLMEAAQGGGHAIASHEDGAATNPRDAVLIGELQRQIADLRKSNYALQQSSESAKEELGALRGGRAEMEEESLNLSQAARVPSLQKTLHIYQEQPIAGAS